MPSLRERLRAKSKVGFLGAPERDGVRCVACGHRCFIPEGREGICKVRYNEAGKLYVPWGYVGGTQVDPIEKKPFFHVLPGSKALSFGMLGCDFHCAYCQNWFTSQSLRDPNATATPEEVTPSSLVSLARQYGARLITSTYNEPLITSEWAVEIFRVAKEAGLRTSYVSNGNGTREVLEYLRPHVDFFKIDLKGFRDKPYRSLGGVLSNVLQTIATVHEMGIWLEIVTLLVPGFNDDPHEIRDLVKFLSGISRDIPWHVTAFHRDYKMTSPEDTSASQLIRAAEIGKEEGLHFVYVGNLPGRVGEWENTYCPNSQCGEELVVRRGFRVLSNKIERSSCPSCHKNIPGNW